MNTTKIIAEKEIKDALRNRLLVILMGMLLLLTLVSIILSAYQIRVSMNEYEQSVAFLKTLGKSNFPDKPNVNPLSVLKDFVNYIGMLGALIAIVLGNYSIEKERRNGTMRLILTRQIYRDRLLAGKLLGNLTILAAACVAMFAVTLITLTAVGRAMLTADDIARLLLFFLMTFLYMLFFLILSMTLAAAMKDGNRALLMTVIIWIILSFVFPQIGDTMDMDNQLPGGFFAQMGISADQEAKVLANFKFYETLRDGIEELSPLTHLIRSGYSLLNVYTGFDTYTPLGIMAAKWVDLIGLTVPGLILWMITYMVFQKREDIY